MLSKYILDIHPWSDSTEFREIGRGSSDCGYTCPLVPFAELFLVHAESFVSDFRILGLTLNSITFLKSCLRNPEVLEIFH